MKKYKIFIIVLITLLVAIFSVAFYYNHMISPMSRESDKVIVEIKSGSMAQIGNTLYENKLIRNTFIFKVYVKINNISNLKASVYELDRNMKLSEIINVLEEGNSYNPDQITITFKEGLNVRKIAKLISENTNNSYEDIMNVFTNKEYAKGLIDKYWFLENDILNDKIYYPLEGYLFPNTYTFLNKDVSVKTIIETMLDEMDKQLTKYKEELQDSEYSIHQLLTLASIVELEGARSDDRASVAGVFYNRIKSGWTLGSDVTTYYYLKIDDFKISLNGNANLYTCDYAYNTRCSSFTGLPVGPISNPGNDSIKSTIKYRVHNYYYFVADCNGKTYLSKNETEHYNTIEKLKRENNWCV